MATVMVVEDVAGIRETVARILKLKGYSTICVTNGLEALAALDTSAPDLILLDIMMPEMDGMQCLKELRRDPRASRTPIIMMSALCDQENQQRARELGAQEYLVKSHFSVEDLLDRIDRCMPHN
jgi:adenylate cyclase